MKIIEPGKLPAGTKMSSDLMRGRCETCGCYAECIRGETFSVLHNSAMRLIKCPTCGDSIVVKDFPRPKRVSDDGQAGIGMFTI